MRTRLVVVAPLAIALPVLLAGCGSESYTPLKKANFAQSISGAATSMKSVHMRIEASSGLRIEADFNYEKPAAMQLTLTDKSAKSTISIRVLGSTIYLQLPPATPVGKWVKTDAAALSSASTQFYAGISPKGIADQFKKGLKSVTYVGAIKLDGQAVRHYTIVEDASQIGSALKALASQVPSLGHLTSITEQIYVDDHNLLRRMTVALPAPIGAMEVDTTQWNAPISISAPPSSSVITSGGS